MLSFPAACGAFQILRAAVQWRPGNKRLAMTARQAVRSEEVFEEMEHTEPFVFKAGDYPEKPGCYLMRTHRDACCTSANPSSSGAACDSDFNHRHERKRVRELVAQIASIEIILVNNETESLLLESNLIKIDKPLYTACSSGTTVCYADLELIRSSGVPWLAVHQPRSTRTGGNPAADKPPGSALQSASAGPRRFGSVREREILQ